MRFIHKGGRIIPIHSDHGDQPAPTAAHAAPGASTPAPAKAEAPAHQHAEASQTDRMAHAREVRKFNQAHPIYAGVKKALGIKPSRGK